ncbi:hypothetical protein MMC20_004638 [Loxospora ochrophaea]|nr:hypothetical protein [Loxospora ochrophaea]
MSDVDSDSDMGPTPNHPIQYTPTHCALASSLQTKFTEPTPAAKRLNTREKACCDAWAKGNQEAQAWRKKKTGKHAAAKATKKPNVKSKSHHLVPINMVNCMGLIIANTFPNDAEA